MTQAQENTIKIKYALLGTIVTLTIITVSWIMAVEVRLSVNSEKCDYNSERIERESLRTDATIKRIEEALVRIEEKIDRR